MSDFYKILDVDKNASASDIKKAFYKKAGEYHPDKPTGDEKKFKEVNEAYQTLSDENKRAHYDRFGSAPQGGAGGNPFGQGGNPFGNGFGGFQNGGFEFNFGGDGNIDLDDILSQFMGFGGANRTPRGRSIQAEVTLSFAESITGSEQEISVPVLKNGKHEGNKTLKVTIPAGVEHGSQLKVSGAGEIKDGGIAGDLIVLVKVRNHSQYEKRGRDILGMLKLPLAKALLGGKQEVELWDNTKIEVTIPECVSPGQLLRVRGKGVQGNVKGDLLLVVEFVMPKRLSKEVKKLAEEML